MKILNSRASTAKAYSQCGASNEDYAGVAPGLDCDNDGGIVRYLNSAGFKVAIKRMALVNTDGSMADIIADTGTLANSEYFDLKNPVTMNEISIPTGSYNAFYVEFYYYDINMPVHGADRDIRIYLSDDDFPQEGSLGHHQGDVLMKALGDGIYKFVYGGQWDDASLQTVRNPAGYDELVGAGGTDPQTGHKRGLFGDEDFWNSTELNQGASQDIFKVTMPAPFAIPVTTGGGSFTLSFDLQDTWFFEDFDNNQIFSPCVSSIEACDEQAAWSPSFPSVSFTFN
jgi:hypothetical protein